MLRYLAIAAALAIGATTVYAQNADVIDQRQKSMKALGGAAKGPGGMMKGATPFDLAVVKTSLMTFQEQAAKSKDLYPDDSKSGDTKALPIVWEKKDDFLGKFDGLVAAAKAAETSITDEASFKAEWGKVMASCGGCHKVYREAKK